MNKENTPADVEAANDDWKLTLILQLHMKATQYRFLLTPDFQTTYYAFVLHRRNSPLFPSLPTLFQLFESPFHIPRLLQVAILREADLTVGQEWELFINKIFVQYATVSHWLLRTSDGLQHGGRHERIPPASQHWQLSASYTPWVT